MVLQRKSTTIENDHQLSKQEQHAINQKVAYEILLSQYKLIKPIFVVNILVGGIIVSLLWNKAGAQHLIAWYFLLVLINIINLLWASYFKHVTEDIVRLEQWRKLFYLFFTAICLIWGSLIFLINTLEPKNGFYFLAFILAMLLALTFTTVTDLFLAILGISSLLTPPILFYLCCNWLPSLNSSLTRGSGSGLAILGLFLILVVIFGSKLIKRFFQLSLTNLALSHKLNNSNKLLEQRVKERTIQLEKSLLKVTYQATHDLLTDLPNHRSLIHFMNDAIKWSKQDGHMFGVVFFALNELEKIYNALGHQAGDLIIQTVARLYSDAFNEPTIENFKSSNYIVTISRKNVFVFLIQPILSFEEVEHRLAPLFSLLQNTIRTDKQVVRLTASAGVSLYPAHGRDVVSLLMNADAAMLLAKQSGGNAIKLYKSEINASISKQLELESRLRRALIKEEFIVQYQPIVRLEDELIIGVEALVRWENPALGRIPPDHFIPLAEANGIIVPLGDWVLREAAAKMKVWHDEGFSYLTVAVNISARQLQVPDFVQSIINVLNDCHINPTNIQLELTERIAFQPEATQVLRKLKSVGFSLSIDDFGTGYSGFSNIKLFNIDKLKIDKSFVQDMFANESSMAIVKHTITLAKTIGVKVIAEGVETQEQLNELRKLNCDAVQGYLFKPPVNAQVITQLLKENNGKLAPQLKI